MALKTLKSFLFSTAIQKKKQEKRCQKQGKENRLLLKANAGNSWTEKEFGIKPDMIMYLHTSKHQEHH